MTKYGTLENANWKKIQCILNTAVNDSHWPVHSFPLKVEVRQSADDSRNAKKVRDANRVEGAVVRRGSLDAVCNRRLTKFSSLAPSASSVSVALPSQCHFGTIRLSLSAGRVSYRTRLCLSIDFTSVPWKRRWKYSLKQQIHENRTSLPKNRLNILLASGFAEWISS